MNHIHLKFLTMSIGKHINFHQFMGMPNYTWKSDPTIARSYNNSYYILTYCTPTAIYVSLDLFDRYGRN